MVQPGTDDERIATWLAAVNREFTRGGMNQNTLPGTTRTQPNSVAYLCVPNAPVGFCLSAGNYAGDDPESRRAPFLTVASGLTYAASPGDITTWFDANDALPS